ncbi:MAG TPA: BamA/TamA family outer membrane protein [Thermoanaerobaculia bacterium]|nr:BamA/TamA family outer membrane protein [Thermoanaerobaculia bacterium]
MATVLVPAPPAEGQYFGRNKVLWEDFQFQVLQTEHFDIYYYPADHPAIDELARLSERWYRRLSTAFDHQLTERKPIIFYADQPDFRQTTLTFGLVGEGTGGFTEPLRDRVVLPLTPSFAETDHVLGHELVHAFQFDIATALSRGRRSVSLQSLPLWMVEGLAEYFSQGRRDPQTAMWMRDAVVHDELPNLRRLTRDPRFSPYQYGQAFWAYVGGRWGDDAVTRLFATALVLGPAAAFEDVLGQEAEAVFEEWHADVERYYRPVLGERSGPEAFARLVLGEETTEADLNLAPSLSPDGRWVAFLSTRDLFSIDLFLADARTGEVRRRLVSAAGNPHFDALRFLDSAGAWSPDGRRFAFVAFERGDNTLVVIDVDSGDVVERYRPPVGAIANPYYAPDGRSIVFSGTRNGISDLYLLDVASGDVRQLTDDLYTDIQPAYSPDGRTIVFVTDRGPGTDFGTELTFAPLRLGLYDVASGDVQAVTVFEGAKHIDPHFSPDGRTLYFISDFDGVSDLFAYSLAEGQARRLTRVQTGVAGISDLSPALAVASRTGEVMFSVYEGTNYNVYALNDPAAPGLAEDELRYAGLLPPPVDTPLTVPRETVQAYLASPDVGLPPAGVSFDVEDYDSRLGLTYIGPPSLAIGTDRYGSAVGGSISALFTDMLNQHLVGVTIQGSNGSGDLGSAFGGEVIYLNQTDRLTWGAEAAHVPLLTARTFVDRELVDIDGQLVAADVVRQIRDEVTFQEVGGIAQYPLSLTRRLEVNAGYRRIGFDRELREAVIVGNQVLSDETTNLASAEDLSLYNGALAYVGDSSFFGFVSPVRGTRYRFEVEANSGDLDFQTGLADYRRYFFRRPWTLAVRGMHYGRYGDDAENERLGPLYVGRDTLVRGYDINDFEAEDCTPVEGTSACPEFDRLVGSKMAVASVEVRVPLFGTEDFGLIELPYLPTELVAFVDAGVAWTEDESPELTFDTDTLERVPVVSAGLAARIVLGGYLPIQLYYAHPFHREDAGWQFGLVIAPGW